MGADTEGQLGDGTNVNHYFPEPVYSSGVNAVAAGYYYSLFRTSVGTKQVTVSLLGMGDDEFGQLGDNATTNYYSPEAIQSTTLPPYDVVTFAGGQWHTLFVRSNGSLWGMGFNGAGQLGNGGTMDQHSPVQIRSNNVVAAAAGGDHSLFIDSAGGLWAMGFNAYGELSDNSTTDKHTPEQVGANVTAIAAGAYFSLYIKTDGSLWGMGYDASGQLGLGVDTATNKYLPVQIVASNVVAVSAGEYHSLFLKSDGSLWGMGFNDGQLGDGTYMNQLFPIRIVPPPPTPVLIGYSFSGNNVTLNASNGLLGATYYAITSTNMALPASQWTVISTKQLSGDGNFTIIATNAVIPAAKQQFFLIQLLY
jgi:alpha-tubulin suppressor-like RCC1 family protein